MLSWGITSNTSSNTIAALRVPDTAVKYEFCDTHTSRSRDRNFTPGNYLLFFFAFGGVRWARPLQGGGGAFVSPTPLDVRVKITQTPPWAWRATGSHQAAGESFFASRSLSHNVVPTGINRTAWRRKSHLIWCVVFQSSSAETPATEGQRGTIMDRSLAWNT